MIASFLRQGAPFGLCLFSLLLLGCPPAKPGVSTSAASPSPSVAPSASPSVAPPRATPAGPIAKLTIYPATIAPPEGQQWPVKIQPLPPALVGVPSGDREYIEIVFTVLLEATDAKIRLLHAIKRTQEGKTLVDGGRPAKIKDKVRRYRSTTTLLQERLGQLNPSSKLEAFHQSLLEALGQQLLFFKATMKNRVAWSKMPELASAKRSRYLTVRAWTQLKGAFPKLDAAATASFKSHLDALRLY
ncbi:MAG: hypothetical protein JKY65_11765 [Planctomycetes bacterium]|nr:hypothetical protein [Planctomycetota bacterium]